MAHRDLHERVVPHLTRHLPPLGEIAPLVLDLGAGTGSMSQKLAAAGYRVAACDLEPDLYEFPGAECRRADLAQTLPYDDESFDAVVCLEVLEHLDGHLSLFTEIRRILRPGGLFLFSTPNVMSIKSRLSFLSIGFPHSFYPLNTRTLSPQEWHISGFSGDRYNWALNHAGLELLEIGCDKYSRTSLAFAWLVPWIKFRSWIEFGRARGAVLNNSLAALLGRSMVGIAAKPADVAAAQADRVAKGRAA